MKSILLLTALLTFQTANAKVVSINCDNSSTHNFITTNADFETNELDERSLTVRDNFASANVNCPSSIRYAVEEKKRFNCAGIWQYDTRTPDNVIGTPIIVQFIHVMGTWMANFKTSYAYDRAKRSLSCDIKIIEN